MKKIKVVLSSIWFPLAMATYFWRALKRRNDVELFVAGPFSGSWIPWGGGMHLQEKYIMTPDCALPIQAIGHEYQRVLHPNMISLPWRPDIWIQVDAGFHFASRPDATIVAHVQTDPHVLKQEYTLPKSYSDLNFCMQKVYSTPDEIYLPYAYDPTVHYPMNVDKIYDACLLGLHYDTRNSLVGRLQERGLSVKYGIGEVFDEYRLAYNQSRIALSWSSLLDIPTRVFEAMAMKLPLVANIVPDMPLFFEEGKDYFGFTNLEEADKRVGELLVNEELRSWVAENGHKKVKEHTWDNRVTQILKAASLV